MACRGTVEPVKRRAFFYLLGLRALVEHVEHASARCERLLQRRTQVRHGDNRAERRHERRTRDRRRAEGDHPAVRQVHCRKQHAHIEREHHRARRRHGRRRAVLQAAFHLGEAAHAACQLVCAVVGAPELQRFAQTAQTVEHERVHGADGVAHLAPARAARLRRDPRHRNAHDRIGEGRVEGQKRRERRRERHHDDRHDKGNRGGRERVRIEHLEKLDVACEQGHEVTLVAALELCGRKRAHLAEHLVAHKREDLERQVVVAQLLAVAKRPADHAAHGHERARRAHGERTPCARRAEQAIRCEHGEEDRREKAEHAQHDGKRHHGKKRARKPHKPRHDGEIGAAARRCGARRPTSVGTRGANRLTGFARHLQSVHARNRARGHRARGGIPVALRERLQLRLALPQPRIGAFPCEQLGVRAMLREFSLLKDINRIGLLDCRQAVRDHDDRVAARKLARG